MPGSYFPDFDLSTRPSLQLTTTRARPPLFLPPTSPSASSSLSKTGSSRYGGSSNTDFVSRKRIRRNDYDSDLTAPRKQSTPKSELDSQSAFTSGTCTPVAESPAAFVNTRYRIAGGLDTPSAAWLDADERYAEDMKELDYRPSRLTLSAKRGSASYFPRTPAGATNIRQASHKRARSADQTGWGRVVVNLVGGVAGRVFNFCWNSAFRGFQAGGGQAYTMDFDTPAVVEQSTWMEVGEKDDVFNKNYEGQRRQSMTPVPGQFPEEGLISDYMSHPQAHQTDQPSTPVPRGEEGASTLRGSWVMVNDTDGVDERDRSSVVSANTNSRARTQYQRRPNSRVPLNAAGNRPRLTPSRPSLAATPGSHPKRPASYASPRSSPGRSDRRETHSSDAVSNGHRRSQSSVASPRQATEFTAGQNYTTSTSPDVQRFEKKIRRKERKEDESIQRLNKQLQDMIKEGKEALGTTIEIEDDEDEDEGYGEGMDYLGTTK